MCGISGTSADPRNPITQALPALQTSPTAQHTSARRVRACPEGPQQSVVRHLLTWPRRWCRRTSVPDQTVALAQTGQILRWSRWGD